MFLFNSSRSGDKLKIKKANKSEQIVKAKLKQDFTFLYLYGINNQEIKSLIKTLHLPIIITKEIQYADAILALANLVKSNKKLKQISHSKKITIHTIQSNSLVIIAKTLRLLAKKNAVVNAKESNNTAKIARTLSKEILTPLEETRLAIEEVVIPKNVAVDLFPRTCRIRKQQHELIVHYQLTGISVGKTNQRRIRIFPN